MKCPDNVFSPACEDDLDAVMSIERASFAVPWSRDDFTACLYSDAFDFTVARRDKAVAGYCVSSAAADEGEVLSIAVGCDFRRAGIGRSLLDEAVRKMACAGAKIIYLEVRESNAPAIALYTSAGFEPVGRRRKYYQLPVEDALVMRLQL